MKSNSISNLLPRDSSIVYMVASFKNNEHEYINVIARKMTNNVLLMHCGKTIACGLYNSKKHKLLKSIDELTDKFINSYPFKPIHVSIKTAKENFKYISDIPIYETHWLVAEIDDHMVQRCSYIDIDQLES